MHSDFRSPRPAQFSSRASGPADVHASHHVTRSSGFTLIELMVTLSVLAILATLAAPAMHQLLARNRLAAAGNEMLGLVAFARSEALTRHSRITLCGTLDPQASLPLCAKSAEAWATGILVFQDNGPRTGATAGQPAWPQALLRIRVADQPGIRIQRNGTSQGPISFGAHGALVSALGVSFALTASTTSDLPERHLCIARTGRARIVEDGCS